MTSHGWSFQTLCKASIFSKKLSEGSQPLHPLLDFPADSVSLLQECFHLFVILDWLDTVIRHKNLERVEFDKTNKLIRLMGWGNEKDRYNK